MAKLSERDRTQESMGGILLETAIDGLVAFATGGQAGATPILAQTVRIATVATAGDSVLLPQSKYGMTITVINDGVAAVQVFGSGADTINGVAAAMGVSQMPGSMVIYECPIAGKWF